MFEEKTIQWDGNKATGYNGADVMVHVDCDTKATIRAYTYVRDAAGWPESYILEPSKNPLFVYLTREFIEGPLRRKFQETENK